MGFVDSMLSISIFIIRLKPIILKNYKFYSWFDFDATTNKIPVYTKVPVTNLMALKFEILKLKVKIWSDTLK